MIEIVYEDDFGPIHMHTFTYVSEQIYLRCHVNAFTYMSINTPGVNWGK